MKVKIIMLPAVILFVSYVITGCQKDVVDVLGAEQSARAVGFIAIENSTDSGTVVPKATTKTGFTVIVQRNNLKDSSVIDSIKLYYQNTSPSAIVDSSTLTSANLADSIITAPYTAFEKFYYTFTSPSANFITGKTYNVIGVIYTAAGNTNTATYSSVFKW
jgi:hypothetical protein